MKKLIFGSMLLSGALLASCTESVYDAPVIESYTKSFIQRFGTVHPEQDWNVAERKSVTVNPGSEKNVKIYSLMGDAYKMVGNYSDLSGETSLSFDASQNVNDFVVTVGNRAMCVKNGEKADFGVLSRTYPTGGTTDVWKKLDDHKRFPLSDVLPFLEKLPESSDNRNNATIHSDFLGVTTASRSIKVYPVYWNASYKHTLGIYTYDDTGNNITYYPIYNSRVGDDVKIEASDQTELKTPAQLDCWGGGDTKSYAINNAHTKVEAIHSRGFEITLPEGVVFGFYIDAVTSRGAEVGRWHSERHLNTGDVGSVPNGHAAFTSITTEDENGNRYMRTYLGFEDCQMPNGSLCDNDLNDLVLIFDPAPVIIDHTTEEWILAAEDLGQTDDFDFNDMVVSVKHVAGSDKAEITPRAAGGIYEIYLMRNDQVVAPEGSTGEFHTLISQNVGPSKDGLYPMLNTYSPGPAGQSFTISVPTYFSMATYGDIDQMGGFSLKVVRPDQSPSEIVVSPPGNGDIPQMICVPASWKWPKERVGMEGAYPTFGNFGYDYTNVDWISSCVPDSVLTNK